MIPPAEHNRTGLPPHTRSPADPSPPTFVEPERLVALAVHFRDRLGTVESLIAGDSMRSTLPAGSRIRILCGKPERLTRGAVVAFVGGSSLIAHRIVGRGRGPRSRAYLLTRGDATVVCDAPIHVDRVLGIVTHVAVGDQWQPLPRVPHRLLAKVTGGVILGAMVLVMELDARAAGAVAAACFRVRSIAQRVRGRLRRMLGAPP